MDKYVVAWSLNFALILLGGVSFMETTFPENSLFLLCCLKTMHFVLVMSYDKQLTQNKSNKSAKLEFAWLNRTSGLQWDKYNDVSSSAKDGM